jgi:DNA-binding IclR family transcriptional regulator
MAKCFRVLEVLSIAEGPLALSDIVRRVGMDKSAVQRVTHTLRVLGYLRQLPDTRAYAISSKMLAFTHAVLAHDRVRAVAMPLLEELNRRCGETVNLTRLEDTEVVFIARFPSVHPVSVDLHVGSRLPAYCTSPGRAMLARLPEDAARAILQRSALRLLTTHTVTELPRLLSILEQTRKRGYAVNNQETFVGDISIAAAIVDQAGRVAGAINIAAPSPRYSLTALERALANDLMRTAGEVSRSLGVA